MQTHDRHSITVSHVIRRLLRARCERTAQGRAPSAERGNNGCGPARTPPRPGPLDGRICGSSEQRPMRKEEQPTAMPSGQCSGQHRHDFLQLGVAVAASPSPLRCAEHTARGAQVPRSTQWQIGRHERTSTEEKCGLHQHKDGDFCSAQLENGATVDTANPRSARDTHTHTHTHTPHSSAADHPSKWRPLGIFSTEKKKTLQTHTT